ncbi:MAG: transporter [Candidatus Omnitrophica bacterium]|nr:transporter [Candidatus Omnitrophota bacterium]
MKKISVRCGVFSKVLDGGCGMHLGVGQKSGMSSRGMRAGTNFLIILLFVSFVFSGASVCEAAKNGAERQPSVLQQKAGQEKTAASADETISVVTAKLITWDTVPNEPGHVEFDTSYAYTASGNAWSSDGNRHSRELLRAHEFDEMAYVGVVKDLDIFVGSGYAILANKENNFNEVGEFIDPVLGETIGNPSEGAAHGHGIKDLLAGARWRFYDDEAQQLSFAYIPIVQIPVGRRTDYNHLGPSQGYTSMDNRLALTKNIGFWNIDVNLAYLTPLAHLRKTNNYCGTLETNFALGYQWTRWIQPEIEVIYDHLFEKNGKGGKLCSMVFGLIMPVHAHIRLDVGMIQDVLGSNVDQITSGYFRIVMTK